MDREAYNACMRPYITGKGKSKEDRKADFCVGAKICSGKASSEDEARQLCDVAKAEKTEQTRADACANVIPVSQWLEEEQPGECRFCKLPPVIQWYRNVLEESGQTELVQNIDQAVEAGDPALVGWTLDDIKGRASPDLLPRLKEFDCLLEVG